MAMNRYQTKLRVLTVCLGWMGFFALATQPAFSQGYAIDPSHSTILFRIKHLGTSYAWGRFDDIAGRVNVDERGGALEVVLKADSIDTANAKRDQHLKGPDFFNAKQFPLITFKSSRVTRTGENKYDLEGTLNLHGVDRPLKVQLERTGASKNQMGVAIVGYAATFSINRSDFGMKFMLEGLSDEVVLVVSLECAAQ
jgi:polyisoprenoid-binding protein YceI